MVFHEHLEEEESETDSIEPVELGKILEATPVLDDKKQCITMSLRIKSTDDVQLAAPPEPSRNLETITDLVRLIRNLHTVKFH